MILAEASQSDDAATADTVTVAWFGDSDWSDVTSVLRDFLHEQVCAGGACLDPLLMLGPNSTGHPPHERCHVVLKV